MARTKKQRRKHALRLKRPGVGRKTESMRSENRRRRRERDEERDGTYTLEIRP